MNPIFFIKTFAVSCTGGGFFGLPTWYSYLKTTQVIDPVTKVTSCNFSSFTFWPPDQFLLILLAVLDMLLYVSGIIAVVFVVFGGIQYVVSQGNPENTKKAQSTVLNAIIGLVISILAATLVNFIGSQFGK